MASFAEDLKICEKVTRDGGSNLSLISKGLKKPLRHLFAPCYASMRLIDDMVDESFLSLDSQQRTSKKEHYLSRLDDWEQVSLAASNGIFQTPLYDFKHEGHVASPIFNCLSQTLGKSNLGTVPWETMAAAMRRDVEETTIKTWDDFDAYGWGATVSPTAVFLYILTCEYDAKTETYQGRDGLSLMTQARSMGLFCYLVHIARDLVKDSKKNKQLLTIPADVLEKTNSDPHNLNMEEVSYLTRQVLNRAEGLKADMLDQRDDLLTQMSLTNKVVFKSLLGLYVKMYEKLCQNPLAAMQDDFEKSLRNDIDEFTVKDTNA